MLTGLNNVNNVIFRGITPLKQSKACVSNSYVQSPLVKNVSFHGYNTVDVAKTQLTTPSELKAYTEVASSLDSEGKKALDYMLKTGSLLNNNSDDKSTTLDNLHKILLNDRASGLDKKGILNDTVKTIANPYGITQHFGNIPESMIGTLKQYDNSTEEVEHSGCCVAASIEFNLASQMPAEFARIAEGLSSPNMSVKKHLSLNTLCDNKEDSKWLLDNFKIPYTMTDENNVEVTIAPDKNAIFRAHIQTVDKDELERTPVDVLMQSTLMNIGSQQTYNTLNDTRVASFGPGDKGLVEIEKTFTESVVTNSNKTSVTFQDLREGVDIPEKEIIDSFLTYGTVPHFLYRLLPFENVHVLENDTISDAAYLSCSANFDDFIDSVGRINHLACFRIENASPINRIIIRDLLQDFNGMRF